MKANIFRTLACGLACWNTCPDDYHMMEP